MTGPFIFVTRSRIDPTRHAEHLAHAREVADIVEADEPRIIALNVWESADRTETSRIEVHPDVESLEFHLELLAKTPAGAPHDALETFEYDIYGEPSDAVLSALQSLPGARVRVCSQHISGFLRPQPL